MASSRDDRIRALMRELFAKAEAGPCEIDAKSLRQLETLFGTTVWGFREILLVVVVARLLDPSYDPYNALYDCNPRAMYEGPMIEELRRRGIPHRKSGPLNIAKAAQGLNEQWAAQRRPKQVADEVVRIVKKVDRMDRDELRVFAVALHARLLQEASRIAKLVVEARPESDPVHLYELCYSLIDEVPDGGNTPQRIVGLLMEAYHEELQTGIKVEGHLDSASVTSTTSHKPGDITEEQSDGTILLVYEVTVKRFGDQRMAESYSTVWDYNEHSGSNIKEVVVICRPDDAHSSADYEDGAAYLGKVEYQDLTYHFLDIYEWILGQLGRSPADARLAFHERLAEYVAHPNTSEKVKRKWVELNR